MSKPKIRFYFAIYSDSIAPESITDRLNIKPTATSRKGEIWHKRTGKVHPRHVWRLSSEFEESFDIDSQIEAVLPKLFHVKNSLAKLLGVDKTDGIFQFVIETYGSSPAMHLDKKIVSFAGELNIEFDFDLYLFSSETTE